jgi:hypothetical protein
MKMENNELDFGETGFEAMERIQMEGDRVKFRELQNMVMNFLLTRSSKHILCY